MCEELLNSMFTHYL